MSNKIGLCHGGHQEHLESRRLLAADAVPIHTVPMALSVLPQVNLRFAERPTLASPTLAPGVANSINVRIANDSNQTLHANPGVYVYLSTDRTFSEDDRLIGIRDAITVQPNQSLFAQIPIYYSNQTPTLTPGTYFVISRIDPHNRVVETNEADNFTRSWVSPIQVQSNPNPVTTNLHFAAPIQAQLRQEGFGLRVNASVRVVGNFAGPYGVSWWFSDRPDVNPISDPLVQGPRLFNLTGPQTVQLDNFLLTGDQVYGFNKGNGPIYLRAEIFSGPVFNNFETSITDNQTRRYSFRIR